MKKLLDQKASNCKTYITTRNCLIKEVRMQKQIEVMCKVNACLVKDVSISKEGIQVKHPSGTNIVVDIDEMIGMANGDHFDINLDEFKVVYPH